MDHELKNAMAVGAWFLEDCKAVFEIMEQTVKPSVDRWALTRDNAGTVSGVFLRAFAWMGTYRKLDHPSEFQPALAGARALFEMAVDLALLVGDRAKHPVDMMLAWEDSSKLLASERVARFFEVAVPKEHALRVAFVHADGPRIRAARQRWWPNWKGKHPPRWTGRNLDADAREADRLLGRDLERYYVERYADVCWGTHASTLVGARHSADTFPMLMVLALRDAAMLAMLVSELVLRYFDAFEEIAQQRFRLANEQRELRSAHAFAAKQQSNLE